MNTLNTKTTFAKNVAYPGLLVLIILSLVAAFFPDTVNTALTNIQDSVYRHMSWVYILLVSFFVISLLVLTFSKMGNIRLGADNSEPQYSFFSWISMLFAAGMGIGLMYFGVAEPMSHYVYPALPEIANHAKDAQLATFFHWGIHAWAIFAVMGLVLAYFSFRYKLPLSIRSGLYPILGDRIHGRIGDVVDIFALVSTFFGISTSMGFGVMQLNAGLVHLGLLRHSDFLFQCVIIIVVSALAISSAVAGVNKGVKRLSEINIGAAIVMLLFVLFLGPTTFLLSAFLEGVGNYIENFATLTFNTFAFHQLDSYVLGVVDKLGTVRGSVHRPHIKGAYHPRVCAGGAAGAVTVHLSLDDCVRQRSNLDGPECCGRSVEQARGQSRHPAVLLLRELPHG